ncbi:hypothetical protein C4588_06805, partial [Candidatus Parcubacteria bacterium]
MSPPYIPGDTLYQVSENPEIRDYQLVWLRWLLAKLYESEKSTDSHATNHWRRLLKEFQEKTGLELYVSPFTG